MDVIDIARYVGALFFVLALVGLAALATRRYGVGGFAGGGGAKRLCLVETLMIDARHRLVLVRRDDREHLVLLGPDGVRIVENEIVAPETASNAPNAMPTALVSAGIAA